MKRTLIPGGFIEAGQYLFFLTDHLGSTHLLADKEAMVYQQVNYYHFGMAFADGVAQDVQPYKFTGKELDNKHKIGIYDSHARQQDTQIPRFLSIDPLAEKYYSWSPYVYVMNNPINAIDPDGRNAVSLVLRAVKVARRTYKVAETYVRTKVSEVSMPYNHFMNDEQAKKAQEKFLEGIDKRIEEIKASEAAKESKENSDERTEKDPLRRDKDGEPAPDPEAKGTEHTQLGTKKGSKGDYKQSREFDKEGKPVKDIDHTDHGRSKNHPNPHQHKYKENPTGGTKQRNKRAEPLD